MKLGASGDEAVVRATVCLVVPGALAFPDRQRGAVGTGCLENSERDGIDVRDRQGAGLGSGCRQLGGGLEAAEEVRLLEDHARGVGGGLAELVRVGDSAVVADLDDLEAEPGRVRLHDLPHLRAQCLAEDDLVAAGHVLRDEAGIGGDCCPVVAGRVRNVHAGQLADNRLVLEDRLQHPLAHLRLVGGVRGQELAAGEHRVDHRRDVVVVDPGAEERELLSGVHIALGELGQVRDELWLRERRLERELAAKPDALGNVPEELVDRRDVDRCQHRVPVGFGE